MQRTLQVIIREMQGIDLLVSALKLFSSSEEVQEQVCTALANLSLDPAARLKILSIKGVETICAVLQSKPPCKVSISTQGCGCATACHPALPFFGQLIYA
jgi:hypothetical protein